MTLKDLNIDISYVISMEDFLKNFVGIDNQNLSRAKHKELKFFNSEVSHNFHVHRKPRQYHLP